MYHFYSEILNRNATNIHNINFRSFIFNTFILDTIQFLYKRPRTIIAIHKKAFILDSQVLKIKNFFLYKYNNKMMSLCRCHNMKCIGLSMTKYSRTRLIWFLLQWNTVLLQIYMMSCNTKAHIYSCLMWQLIQQL